MNKTLEKFCKEGKRRFYLSEFVAAAKVSLQDAEDFFLVLLRKDEIEGELEVRCPCCGKDIGVYRRVSQIPEEIECEICGFKFPRSNEYIEIILEVKGECFRDQSSPLASSNEVLEKEGLHEILQDAVNEKSKVKKGWKFEQFFEALMRREKDFIFKFKHSRSELGEIDYVYCHSLQNHYFWRISPYICVECKNWKGKITSTEIGHLTDLIRDKTPLSCCGVFITTSSYSQSAIEAINLARLKDNIVVIPIEGKELTHLVKEGFRNFAQKLCEEKIFKKTC